MSAQAPLLVAAAPTEGPPGWVGRFGPGDAYTDIWLCLLGPTSFLVWDRLARRLEASLDTLDARFGLDELAVTTTSVDELCRLLGLGVAASARSRMRRTLARLERFRLAQAVNDELLLLRSRLPLITARQAVALPPALRALHERTVGDRVAPRR